MNVHGIMNGEHFGSLALGFILTLQETRSIHDFMNIPKIEFIAYIYILFYIYYIKLFLIKELKQFCI